MRTLVLFLLCISWWGRSQVDAAGTLRHVSNNGVVYAAAPQERGAYAVGANSGQSHYGYNTGDGIAKVEVRQADGSVTGSYRYFDPNGKQVVRSYIADRNGFRVLGNDLPISPDTPASQVLGAPALTGAFEGTTDFDIPPPLTSGGHFQPPQQVQLQQQQDTLALQLQQQQQQQQEHQRQQQQLEKQMEALRVQQRKLIALQRQLEEQQRSIRQPSPFQTQIRPKQQVSSRRYSHSSLQQHHPYYQRQDTLTGGVTSPYYYFKHDLNYDFPAGFAYQGLPVTKPEPVRRGCGYDSTEPGCGHNYIIGRAR